jgi:predicted unusual protein kinase regulating ubiquinone biosynthesis (AarF/ABC1/UbiB family)
MKQYMVDSDEDMPGFGEVELYDYQKDIDTSKEVGKNLLENLVNLYLGDAKEVLQHPYIKTRMEEDAEYYSQMKTIQKLSEKLLLQQMRQIDSGDTSPRMYEITTRQIGEIRENVKDGRKAKLEIESMYKEMRKDLGLNEVVNNDSGSSEQTKENDNIIDSKNLNDKIDSYLKNKES